MANISLTNIISNGGFETNVAGWAGGASVRSGGSAVAHNAVTCTRVATLAPGHSESGSWSLQQGSKEQGAVWVVYGSSYTALTNINVVQGRKYYIKALIRLRGTTPGVVSVGTFTNNYVFTTQPSLQVAVPPLADGMTSTDVNAWKLMDCIWECPAGTNVLNPKVIWQTTANQGNNEVHGQLDNVMIIDLTTPFGSGNEPPLFAIREAVKDEGGYWDGTKSISIPVAPAFDTSILTTTGLTGRSFSFGVQLISGTGTVPFSFALSGLPVGHGLSINSSGQITGTLGLLEGSYPFTVTVTDAIGYQVTQGYTLNVGEPPIIEDTFIPGAIYNEAYSYTPTVSGSEPIIVSLTVTGGTLPTGLSIYDGQITGTPTVDGQSCQITITAYNDYESNGVTKAFTLVVASAPRINTTSPLANGTLGQAYNLTFSAAGVQPITWEILSGDLPIGMSLNSSGQLSGSPTQTGTFSFSVKATNSLGFDTQLFQLSVYQLPVITTTSFGYARLGSNYSGQLTATGSTPITYTITSGGLPTGLSLNSSTGAITGTPLATGRFTFTVVATNISGNSSPVVLYIDAGLALAITTQSPLPVGTQNKPYSGITFAADGIDGSYAVSWSWTAQSGSNFPPGLSLNTTTGALTGTPTQLGTFNVNVTVTNGATQSTSPFTITIGSPPVITTTPVLGGGIDRPFTVVLNASGTTPITWRMDGIPSPSANITISPQGALTWLIPVIGVYSFDIIATNIYGDSSTVRFSLTITTPSIIDVDLEDGIVGETYSHTFTASGDSPFTWTMPSGSLPPGLSWDASTATISGTPTTVGTYTFDVKVQNIGGSFQDTFSITVVTKPTITTASLNSGNIGTAYSQTMIGTGTTPLSWSIISGSLPPGLNISGATISGDPTTIGNYTITVRLQNITGLAYAAEKTFTIYIGPSGAPVITTGATLTAIKGTPYTLNLAATGNPTITFALDSGSVLPDGLSLNSGVISGTPTVNGVFQFTIKATNTEGSDSRLFTMTINAAPVITTVSLPNGLVDEPYSEQVQATGTTPITWQIMSLIGSETGLPTGLSLNTSTGVISGTPTIAGVFTFRIRANNSVSNNTVALSITIDSAGGTFIQGKEIANMFVLGKEIATAFLNGVQVY